MTRDGLHLEAEIASQLSHLLLLNAQERCDLSLSTLICLVRIKDNYAIDVSADKLCLLLLVLDIHRH